MWEMRCDECNRAFDSNAENYLETQRLARRRGWVVGPLVQCPDCAAANSPGGGSKQGGGSEQSHEGEQIGD